MSRAHSPKHYVKIWAMLVALLVASVVGPMFGIQLLTLITAFGIAIVKAYLVCANFMHLNIEKKYVTYLLATAVAFVLLFFGAASPDVMNHDGAQWENLAAKHETARALAAEQAAGAAHH